MRAHRNARLLAGLDLQELLRPLLKWLQKLFSPQNRPFICYLVFLAIVVMVASRHPKPAGWLGVMAVKAFSRDFLAAKLPAMAGFWGVGLGLFCLFWLLTQPVELRPYRWVRIGLSMVLVYLLLSGLGKPLDLTFAKNGQNTSTFFGFLLPAALLAGTWTPALAWYLAAALAMLMDSPGDTELEPTLKPAYEAARAGQLRLALRLVRPTLRAHFHHYEALVLAACLHRTLRQPRRAQLALLRALKNPELLEAQRTRLLEMIEHQEEAGHDCWRIPGLDLRGADPCLSTCVIGFRSPAN